MVNDPDSRVNEVPTQRFKQTLAETIAWCRERTSSQELRTPDLHPPLLSSSAEDAVWHVALERWRKVGGVAPVSKFPDLEGGRLLIYFPNADLADGAAAVVSDGLFQNIDGSNAPPWDTWVEFIYDPL